MSSPKLRFFNTTGPCNPDEHYMLSPEERLVGAQLSRYLKDKLFWVLHAPRQTGKTTFLQSWMREITARGEMIARYVTVEACQCIAEAERAISTICDAIKSSARTYGLPVPETSCNHLSALGDMRTDWAKKLAPKPLYNKQWHLVEIKLVHDYAPPEYVREEGLAQITRYRDSFAPIATSHLVIFDRREAAKTRTWEEKLRWEVEGDITIVWQ